MKFKVKPKKSNLLFMSSIIILCLITCLMWLILRMYFYAGFYFLFTLIIAHIYYFTNYILEKNYLVVQLGFLKVKIKYSHIQKITQLDSSIKIFLNKISFKIYPNHPDMFAAKIGEYLTNKNS